MIYYVALRYITLRYITLHYNIHVIFSISFIKLYKKMVCNLLFNCIRITKDTDSCWHKHIPIEILQKLILKTSLFEHFTLKYLRSIEYID